MTNYTKRTKYLIISLTIKLKLQPLGILIKNRLLMCMMIHFTPMVRNGQPSK